MSGTEEFVRIKQSLVDTVSTVIVGKREVLELVVIDLIAGGHILFEDNPGLGKTTMARAVAKAVGLEFKRVQFTADLLPSDVTGTFVFDGTLGFKFVKGPVFTQVLLADEINRSPPKTQSALLEAMQERQVTVENQTFQLPLPFAVFATQNPIEYEGTYPLPEAQLDRFMVRLRVGYPSMDDEVQILALKKASEDEFANVKQVTDADSLLRLHGALDQIFVDEDIRKYVVRLVAETRASKLAEVGVSPRGSIHLYRMAQAKAACNGRDYVIPDDVKSLAVPVLSHRLVLGVDSEVKGVTQEQVIADIVNRTPVPKVIDNAG